MDSLTTKATWIWHSEWIEGADKNSAGGFVHFRKTVSIKEIPKIPVIIQISADTKYKLYINYQVVSLGPVKGDEHLWFYDELDIQPYLRVGINHFAVRVLRFYYSSPYATSFPRLPLAGLFIQNINQGTALDFSIDSGNDWEAALDPTTRLRVDQKEDDFLHIYEDVNNEGDIHLTWVPAKVLEFPASHGLSAPWKLAPRMIPPPRHEPRVINAIHNIRSTESREDWENTLLVATGLNHKSLRLPAGTSHHVELEVEHHMTTLLDFRFSKPARGGSALQITYSECYEDEPEFVPYIRCKGDRQDTTKMLIGPQDKYLFGSGSATDLYYHKEMEKEEIFTPFHFRTLRFITLDIQVTEECDLVLKGIDLTTTNYPLDVCADFLLTTQDTTRCRDLWTTSIRTLENCMHDCYEDCPFYEQLQYAMDIRSAALFTYYLSGDDRMARQAIIQLHNSYKPSLGLTASRAPAHQYQIIPHFSLFWICMITDHFEYFGDSNFIRQFISACDGVLDCFARRVDTQLNLVRSINSSTQWDFVDWTDAWKPMGIPPAAERTGFQTYTNMLYLYTLKRIYDLLILIERPGLAAEYQTRAVAIAAAIRAHCFNGQFFTDGLASVADPQKDLSQHNQIWAVLSGVISGSAASEILQKSHSSDKFTPTSMAMSFYTLRAFSMVGGSLYNDSFHAFWDPWRAQLSQGLTTWVEDTVSHRSDCHAWGSAPIYEFLAEVAGLRPAAPRWASLSFQPRIALFPDLDAKIPFGADSKSGIAHIQWRKEKNHIKVTLSLCMDSGEKANVPVHVTLPGGKKEILDYGGPLVFIVEP